MPKVWSALFMALFMALLVALLWAVSMQLSFAQTPVASAAPVIRSTARLVLPADAYLLTPYVSPTGDTLLVHLQPTRGNAPEWIVDARSGARWPGSPAEVMAQYRRLGTESPADVKAGTAYDQQSMLQLGCAAPVVFCTSPADADLVLLLRWARAGELEMEVVDLRPLLAGMDALMAGHLAAADLTTSAANWQLLVLASRDAARRQLWLEALRSIDSTQRWQRLAQAADRGPELLQWPMFRPEKDGDKRLDLRAELELLALRLNITLLARAAAGAARVETVQALAEGLLLANQIGFRGDVASHLVDVLIQRDDAERQTLASALAAEAQRRRVHGLWCYAEWMLFRPCAGTPPWAGAALVSPSLRRPQAAGGPAPAPVTATTPATTPAATPAPTTPSAVAAATQPQLPATTQAGDAPHEWALITGQPNKRVLLAYSETSGLMAPESGAVAGLSFVARALGPVQDGRFEVQISPNSSAPLRLQHGSYRVKVRLVLDYAREDRCQSGLLCLFSSAERHARTERRDVVFVLAPGNQHTERQRAHFGGLLPLVAGGSQRYVSILKEARLAIDSVRFELK